MVAEQFVLCGIMETTSERRTVSTSGRLKEEGKRRQTRPSHKPPGVLGIRGPRA